ncbi:MAG: TetR/AcrR family transcriptional regulator [Clostridia bacterium]|nr:TetR/AcrR family transcriptional regulator [Clostridia bacterium]
MAKYIDTLLRRTLVDMMDEKPLDDISVVELTERAEVNRKTFYNHFPDIAALIVSAVWQELDEITGESPAFQDWEQALHGIVEWLKGHDDFVRAVYASRCKGAFLQAFQERMGEKVAKVVDDAIVWLGNYHGETYDVTRYQRKYLTRYYTGVICSVIICWIEGGMRESVNETVRLVGVLNSDGLFDGVRQFTIANENKD